MGYNIFLMSDPEKKSSQERRQEYVAQLGHTIMDAAEHSSSIGLIYPYGAPKNDILYSLMFSQKKGNHLWLPANGLVQGPEAEEHKVTEIIQEVQKLRTKRGLSVLGFTDVDYSADPGFGSPRFLGLVGAIIENQKRSPRKTDGEIASDDLTSGITVIGLGASSLEAISRFRDGERLTEEPSFVDLLHTRFYFEDGLIRPAESCGPGIDFDRPKSAKPIDPSKTIEIKHGGEGVPGAIVPDWSAENP